MKRGLFFLVLCLLLGVMVAAASEPTIYRNDVQRTGVYDVEPLRTFSSVKWEDIVGRSAVGSLMLVNDVLYVGNQSGGLYAFDAETGERRWVTRGLGNPAVSAVAVVDSVVYVGGSDSQFHALDAATGEELWA